MIRRTLPWLLLLALSATPAMAQKINIDYDKDFRGTVKTFAWQDTDDTSLAKADPLLHSRVVNAIEHFLTTVGIREVAPGEEPDIYVTYHTSVKEEVQFNTTNFGYGYPGGWYSPYGYGRYGGYGGVGMSTSTTSATTYQRGTLVLDVWYRETKNLIWRGTVTGILPEKPEKMNKFIDKVLEKMVKKWDKIRKRELKARAKAGES